LTQTINEQPAMNASMNRSEAEDFLYHEAELLDDWQLEQWAALFTDDAEYLIPPFAQPDADPRTTLFLVYDDRHRIGERAKRLLSRMGHSEFPHSRTRRIISNVRVAVSDTSGVSAASNASGITVKCNFLVYRSKGPVTDVYPGHSTYHLVRLNDEWKIRSKRAALDLASLRPQGRVSIIL
jgi:p-cumate 2,3-dioxygenase subunit beta